MQTRVAVMGIIVENTDSVEQLNHLLHEAPQDVISALSGKIGSLDGISVKTAYSNVLADE